MSDQQSRAADLSGVAFEDLVAEMIRRCGDDPAREGMLRTPERVKESLAFLTKGYGETAASAVDGALFTETHHNIVMVKDIELYSLCEHHMLPFVGKAHIAYIPDRRIVGLSKLPRIVDVFARRLQVQERLTQQIAGAIECYLRPRGVAVVLEAAHFCMMMRGVQKQNSKTVTSAMRGAFRDDHRTRDEFMRLATSVHQPL